MIKPPDAALCPECGAYNVKCNCLKTRRERIATAVLAGMFAADISRDIQDRDLVLAAISVADIAIRELDK